MPRMKPPKGYYTLTEARKKLNLSSAMIRKHVEKGKIHYLLPEGREHGFYFKSDVDRLATELETFFNLEDEVEETTVFAHATAADIPGCVALNRELFTVKDHEDNKTISEKWTKWITKNPEVVSILKRGDEVIGIITMLPFKPDSEKFNDVIKGDTSILLGNVDISTEDIEEYVTGNHVQLYIAEIGIKQSLDRNLKRKCGARLIARFIETIVDLGRRGIVIERVTSVGATKSGVRLLQHFGFSEVIFSRPDTRFFVLDMEESGATVAREYRDAFKSHSSREIAPGESKF